MPFTQSQITLINNPKSSNKIPGILNNIIYLISMLLSNTKCNINPSNNKYPLISSSNLILKA